MVNRNAKEITAAALSGTSLMTLFSYAYSFIEKQNFSEPEQLGRLIRLLVSDMSRKMGNVAGWSLHYAVGFVFAAAYVACWKKGKIRPSFRNALLLGAASGLLGAAMWKIAFKSHPAPPAIQHGKYYGQLIPAHLVFAVMATLAFRYVRKADAKANHQRIGTLS